jgi:hypothetical protein
LNYERYRDLGACLHRFRCIYRILIVSPFVHSVAVESQRRGHCLESCWLMQRADDVCQATAERQVDVGQCCGAQRCTSVQSAQRCTSVQSLSGQEAT